MMKVTEATNYSVCLGVKLSPTLGHSLTFELFCEIEINFDLIEALVFWYFFVTAVTVCCSLLSSLNNTLP